MGANHKWQAMEQMAQGGGNHGVSLWCKAVDQNSTEKLDALGLVEADQLAKQLQIVVESLATRFCQGIPGLRPAVDFLCLGDIPGFVERSQVGNQVAVTHLQLRLQILESPFRPCSQQRHDGQATTLMDYFVQLVEIDHDARSKC